MYRSLLVFDGPLAMRHGTFFKNSTLVPKSGLSILPDRLPIPPHSAVELIDMEEKRCGTKVGLVYTNYYRRPIEAFEVEAFEASSPLLRLFNQVY